MAKQLLLTRKKDIRKAILELKEVDKILGMETMYIGSEKLLVHLDVAIYPTNSKDLMRTIETIKARIRKEVPIVHIIQVEIGREL